MIIKAARQIKNASRYSLQGLKFLLKSEMAARLEIYGFIWIMALFALLKEPKFTFMMFTILFSITLAIEALNTAVEVIIDEISPDYSETARNAKDLGSFAVMCLMMMMALYVAGVLYSANWAHFSAFIMSSFGKGVLTLIFILLSLHFIMKSKHAGRGKWPTLIVYGGTLLGLIVFSVSNYFTGVGIDERVFYHLKTGLNGAGIDDYIPLIFYTFLVFCLCAVFLALCSDFFGKQSFKFTKKISSLLDWERNSVLTLKDSKFVFDRYHFLSGTSILLFILISPFNQNIISLYKFSAKSKLLIADIEFYQRPNHVKFSTKKNIVYLYMEGFERSYLDEERFPGLTPNLKALEKQASSFTKIRDTYGSAWTIAGLVTSQCGVPLFIGGEGNSAGKLDEFLPEALCLGDILRENGYQTQFIGAASLDFAGKGKFLKEHGFDAPIGKNYFKENIENGEANHDWGVYDDRMLEELEGISKNMFTSKQPFGLFGLTVDTHHPKGRKTPSCQNLKYKDGTNEMLNSVLCADKIAAEFVKKIQDMDVNNNTIIVLASDHLAMRNTVFDILLEKKRYNLLMIVDQDPANDGSYDKPGSTLDIGPTILSLIGVKTETFGFGRDLFSNQKTIVETYPNKYNQILRQSIGSLGAVLWRHPQLSETMLFDGKTETLTLKNRTVQLPAILQFDDDGDTRSISHLSLNGPKELTKFLPKDDYFLWVDTCEGLIKQGFNQSEQLSTVTEKSSWCWTASNSEKINQTNLLPLQINDVIYKKRVFELVK